MVDTTLLLCALSLIANPRAKHATMPVTTPPIHAIAMSAQSDAYDNIRNAIAKPQTATPSPVSGTTRHTTNHLHARL